MRLLPPINFFFFLFIATSMAASTTRYNIPISESTKVLETRHELNDLAAEYPLGGLDGQNGGYYLKDGDENVVAVASDSLCEELDATVERLRQSHTDWDDESEGITPLDEEYGPAAPAACAHRRCFNSVICITYRDCHVCLRSHSWCI
jgi:hypothetical protein